MLIGSWKKEFKIQNKRWIDWKNVGNSAINLGDCYHVSIGNNWKLLQISLIHLLSPNSPDFHYYRRFCVAKCSFIFQSFILHQNILNISLLCFVTQPLILYKMEIFDHLQLALFVSFRFILSRCHVCVCVNLYAKQIAYVE